MKYFLAGCTGFIGEAFTKTIIKQGHEIVMLTRNPMAIPNSIAPFVTGVYWNGKTYSKEWAMHIQNSDIVINLSGTSVAGLWTKSYKRKLWNSRILTTGLIIDALKEYKVKPQIFINASAMGYFQGLFNSFSNPFDENARKGQGFMSDLCEAWEKEAFKAMSLSIRTVIPRISLVLGANGGVLPKLLLPFKLNVGHILGDGQQAFPWIHVDDLVALFHFFIKEEKLNGIVHTVSQDTPPLSMEQSMRLIAKLLDKKIWCHISDRFLSIVNKEFFESVSKTPYIKSSVLSTCKFKYPTLDKALSDLLFSSFSKTQKN